MIVYQKKYHNKNTKYQKQKHIESANYLRYIVELGSANILRKQDIQNKRQLSLGRPMIWGGKPCGLAPNAAESSPW